MKKTVLYLILILFVSVPGILAQEFDANQQYNQAMANAKQAFEAKQFSEAVMFYREAIKIKPDARLPKYKIEDIRTIYIEKELGVINATPIVTEKLKTNDNAKPEIELEKAKVEDAAKAEATRKMNEDADKAEAEIRQVPVAVIEISEDSDSPDLNEYSDVVDSPGDKVVGVKKVEPKTQTNIDVESIKPDNSEINLTVREVPEIEKTIPIIEPTPEKKIEPKPKAATPTYIEKAVTLSQSEKQIWIEQEKKRLAETYTNKKTVEEIEKPGKHITRVIMNIDNNVTIYLKVKHSWGATFYFIDEVGLELRSINESYFNTMTNLKTYGG